MPVFSSEQQFLQVVGAHMSFTVAPAREFARGLPPQVGIAVNPDGAVGVPLPPEAVAELCRDDTARAGAPGVASGARVRLFEPDWQDEPVDFLAAAAGEFALVPQVGPPGARWPAPRATRPRSSSGSNWTCWTRRRGRRAHDALAGRWAQSR